MLLVRLAVNILVTACAHFDKSKIFVLHGPDCIIVTCGWPSRSRNVGGIGQVATVLSLGTLL